MGCSFLLKAFNDLSTCRVEDGPIPWTAVALYSDKSELDADIADLLWSVIQEMDRAERSWIADNPIGTGEASLGDANI